MKKFIFSIATLFVLAILITSCQKEFDNSELTDQFINDAKEFKDKDGTEQGVNKDETLILASKVFAVAQSNRNFRALIQKSANIEYGGENVVFYRHIRNQKIGRATVSSFLSQVSRKMGQNVSDTFWETDILKEIPKLSLSIYTGPEGTDVTKWNYSKPVVFVPETELFGGEKEYIGTGFNGTKEVQVSNTNDPDFEVIVISDNSSFVEISPQLTKTDIRTITSVLGGANPCDIMLSTLEILLEDLENMVPSDSEYFNLLVSITDLILIYDELCGEVDPPAATCSDGIQNGNETGIDCGGSCPACPPVPSCNDGVQNGNETGIDCGGSCPACPETQCDLDCERNDVDGREVVSTIQIQHSELKKFCKWWKSNCKVQVNVAYATLSTPTSPQLNELPTKFIIGDRGDMKNTQLFTSDLDLFEYQYCSGVHGDPYAINFIGKHHNAGNTASITFGLPSVKFKIDSVEVNFSTPLSVTLGYTTKDNELGGDLIYYCDDLGTTYTSGSMDFTVTEE